MTEHKTPNGEKPVKATEGQLRQALAALYDSHGCQNECRVCDYAFNLLFDEDDGGNGIPSTETSMTKIWGEKQDAAHDALVVESHLSNQLYVSKPHAQHLIVLVEDHAKPDNRIYDLSSRHEPSKSLGWTGEEIEGLAGWWAQERLRNNFGAAQKGGSEPSNLVGASLPLWR